MNWFVPDMVEHSRSRSDRTMPAASPPLVAPDPWTGLTREQLDAVDAFLADNSQAQPCRG